MYKAQSEIFTVTLEPVKGCNLNCRHCYSDIENGEVMSGEDLNLALQEIINYTKQNGFTEIHFIWHGGEPLLAGIDFFRQAVSVLNKLASGVSCRHFIQTNGLLLDDEYCNFFSDMKFELGISLDGPPGLHDQLRTYRDGKGTHADVIEKVRLLEQHHVPIGFCVVASRVTRGHERRIYKYFQKLGYGFRVNPAIPGWNNKYNNTEDYLLKEGEYGEFLCRLFDEWTSTETERIGVSPLDSYLRAVLEGESTECQHQSTCVGNHLGIKPDGETVLCSRCEDHVLGNIREMSIPDIYSSALSRQIQSRTDSFNECRSCVNLYICHGGCPRNTTTSKPDFMKRDPFCKDYKIIFAHIRSVLRQYNNANVKQNAQ